MHNNTVLVPTILYQTLPARTAETPMMIVMLNMALPTMVPGPGFSPSANNDHK